MEGSTPAYFEYLNLEQNVLLQGYLQLLQKCLILEPKICDDYS